MEHQQQLHQLDQIIQKENDYIHLITKNQSLVKAAAKRLHVEGNDIENTLKVGVAGDSGRSSSSSRSSGGSKTLTSSDLTSFLQEQRERLKKLALANAQRQDQVADFVAASRMLRHDLQQQQQASEPGKPPVDYEERLQWHLRAAASARTGGKNSAPEDAKYYQDLLVELGEKDDDEDMDDDIAVVRGGTSAGHQGGTAGAAHADGGTQAAAHLKCPVTSQLLVDPVKNRVCGHIYSRENIVGLINQLGKNRRAKRCPVAGCGNDHLSEAQLQPCLETATLVRREQHRLDVLAKQRATQANDLVDTDDEM
jgi:Zinc-finger of the MIZ type in Nse subunit